MRILLVWPYYHPMRGAGAIRGAAFAENLSSLGADVCVVAPKIKPSRNDDRQGHEPLVQMGICRIPLFVKTSDILALLLSRVSLARCFETFRPDIVVSSSPPITVPWETIGLSKRRRVPFILDTRDAFAMGMRQVFGNKLRYRFLDHMEAKCCREADLVFAVTETLKETLQEAYGIDRKKVAVVPNGFSLNYMNIPQGAARDIDVLFLGFIPDEGRRGVDLLKVYKRVLEARPDTRFAFVGWTRNRYTVMLEELIKNLGISKGVELIPPVPHNEVPRWLSRGKIGMVPLAEKTVFKTAIGTKVYEYVGTGLPIAALGPSFDCELKRFIEGNSVGLYACDIEGCARNIVTLLEEKNLWEKFHRNALECAKKYDFKDIVRRAYEELMVPLVEGRRSSP